MQNIIQISAIFTKILKSIVQFEDTFDSYLIN